MQRWPREPGINCRCPRTTEANSRATAQVVRGQRNADPASTHRTPQSFPTFVRRHSPRRPTVKLEFAALQHYLVLDRALTLRAASVRRTASLLPGCQSLSKPGALSRAGLSLSRQTAVVADEDVRTFAHCRNLSGIVVAERPLIADILAASDPRLGLPEQAFDELDAPRLKATVSASISLSSIVNPPSAQTK